MTRLAHIFQDNVAITCGQDWSSTAAFFDGAGFRVFDFHPIHLILNSSSMETYDTLQARGGISVQTEAAVKPLVGTSPGVSTFFDQLTDHLSSGQTHTISEVIGIWQDHSR
ncbi:hypothetical protein MTBLM5_30017 [Magnetospirillum sp. LM-5]|nr:hypothetical protein MTBLM5_30017 [Magnetospirillum sp. LM-5]